MQQPLVSVIIPAYNAAPLILETIESVRAQTYQPIEIVIIDDGSKDETAKLLEPLARAGVIRYLYQKNQGQAAARKRGFEESRGQYVSFLDADDLVAPEKISLQVAYLEAHPECGVCYSDILHFWHHQPAILLRKKLRYYSGDIFEHLIRENFIQVMTALIRRDVLERFGIPGAEFRRSDDWYLWLNLSYHGVRFHFMDRILAFQRRQEQGTLSDQKTYFKETAETNLAVYEKFKKILSAEDARKHRIEDLMNFWQFRLAVGYVILKDRKSALAALGRFRKKTTKDFLKALALRFLIRVVPRGFLSDVILFLRERRKRASFVRYEDSKLQLPVSR